MDPLTISMAVAPLIHSSAEVIMLISTLEGSYNNAPPTLLSTWKECRLMQITLIKIQQLIYKNEADLSSTLITQEPLREAFDGALTGCRITLAALNFELDKLVEPKNGTKPLEFGFRAKARLVWKEDIMEQLLDQTRRQKSSLEYLIHLLTRAAILKLVKQDTADIRKTLDRAKSIRSYQGVTDIQSSIHLAHQSVASYGVSPSYEMQLAQSSTYQRAQIAAADELLAGKMKLLGEKYALEEKLDGLRLEVALKDGKVTQLKHEILVRDMTIFRLEHDILLKNGRLLSKDERINELKGKITQREKVGGKYGGQKRLDSRLSALEPNQRTGLAIHSGFTDPSRFHSERYATTRHNSSWLSHTLLRDSISIPTLISDEVFFDNYQEDFLDSPAIAPVIKTNEILENYKPKTQANPTSSGIVGVLFKSCADLFWLMTKELCLHDSIKQKEKAVVRDTYEKFYFWGAGFEAEQGGLDKILVSSTNLKDQILSLLLKISKILDTGPFRKIDSAEVNGQRSSLLSLVESVGEYFPQNETSDTDSIFSNDTDPEDSAATLLDDLQAYVECLTKLRLSLEHPASDWARAETVKQLEHDISALHEAASDGNVEIVQMLLGKGVSTEAVAGNRRTPLHEAASNNNVQIVRVLLEKGANTETVAENGRTPLHEAASNNYVQIVQMLLEKGANAEAINRIGDTPLLDAAFEGNVETVQVLLGEGANIEAVTRIGDTPLLDALYRSNVEIVRMLLGKGANIEAINNYGYTPLLQAMGNIEIVKMLLEKGANTEPVDEDGRTALIKAASDGDVEIVQLLLEKGANTEAVGGKGRRGQTALFEAVKKGNVNVVQMLLGKGANSEAADDHGLTPLKIADRDGFTEVAKLLRDNGARK